MNAPRPQLSRTEISLRVKGILADQLVCHASALADPTELARLSRLDSLRALRIVIAIEESLEIKIGDADFASVKTIGQLIDVRRRRGLSEGECGGHRVNDPRTSVSLAQSGKSQAHETQASRAGRSRVKPRHLSPLLKRIIVEQFAARQSSEDVAEDMRLPVRTVDDVIKLAIMRRAA